MIVVIDGPAGSGKSSTARAVADKTGIQYIDSGALYRALTLIYLKAGKRKDKFFETLKRVSVSFQYEDGRFYVYLAGKDVTSQLRDAEVNRLVSEVAALAESRQFVNDLMKKVVRHDLYIAEGRDLGTAVFPEAELKFFMVADPEIRARRRYRELRKKEVETSLEEVQENIRARDRKDSRRENDPLKKADDAIEIDTTDMTFEQQVQFICLKIDERLETKK